MGKQFLIKKICSEEKRPEYLYLIDEYLEDFVNTNILIPYKIINGKKWNIWLSMMIGKEGGRGPKGVYVFNKPTTVSKEQVKIYFVQIPYEEIFKNSNIVENVVKLYFEAIKQFFVFNYKKINAEDFDVIKEKLDWKLLFSFPYPVNISEQHYVGDISELNFRQI